MIASTVFLGAGGDCVVRTATLIRIRPALDGDHHDEETSLAVLAGIDEAGYGPMLGPLVVSGVAVEVPDEAAQDCLWKRLGASTTNRLDRHDPRLPVVDSKRLYQRKSGLKALERTALVAARTAGLSIATLRDLLGGVAPRICDQMNEYPWYRGFDVSLPLENAAATLELQGNALAADLRRSNCRMIGLFAEPLLEGRFNSLVSNTRNKASVSMSLAFRVVQRVAANAPGQALHVLIDRQGGRVRYASVLGTAFGASHIDILGESDQRSAYALDMFGRRGRVEFITAGEDHHFLIALAGLRPTAGYYQDARRFLGDIAEVLKRERVDEALLIRSR